MEASQRDRVLPKGWQESKDLALATAGDSTGFHLLVAEASTGYQWRTLATLSEPGMDTDQWIGNACLTGSGKRVMAVYAPRHFTNRPQLFARGAFAAIIDVDSGAVTKLKDQVTLAYFNPGCGADGTVALTQGADEEHPTSRLLRVETGGGKVTDSVVIPGQITSAVPYRDGFVAARGNALVSLSTTGKMKSLAVAASVPFDVHVDAQGGVAFAEQATGDVTVRYHAEGKTRMLAKGPLGALSVRSGSDGRVFLLGETDEVRSLPGKTSLLPGPAAGQISSDGKLVVKSAARSGLRQGLRGDPRDTRIPGVGKDSGGPEAIDVAAEVPATEANLNFEVSPAARQAPEIRTGSVLNPRLAAIAKSRAKKTVGAAEKPAATSASGAALAAESPIDDGYTCAVPRNDPNLQVYQPHWRQVEWAVDQLVQKRLQVTRSNWKSLKLTNWSPQAEFPAYDLEGKGRVPTNIMLGILAQESNLWQAQRRVAEGELGNPLVGNYYGVDIYDDDPSNDWAIDFSKADCGYGISQQTDHMRKAGSERPGETAWPADKQKAVALDYVTNIAAGLRTLTEKWNQIWIDTGGAMKANDGNAAKLENWYYAIWAYNSGWHPEKEANGTDANGDPNNGAWGLGWTNNPSNSYWKPGRHPFLDGNTYADAATPQYWPYQEKVLGWAAWPITKTYWDPAQGKTVEQAGYNAAWWNHNDYRSAVVPVIQKANLFAVDVNAFCTADNNCQPGTTNYESPATSTAGTCLRADFKCWWHMPKTWKSDCTTQCGNEGTIRYSDDKWRSTEREDPQDYWYPCQTPGLPSGAKIVDDVPSTVPAFRGGCDNSGWTNSGTFSLEFGRDSAGRVPAKADFQQLGNGFGGHEWFGYARNASHNGAVMRVIGTWTLNQQINGPAQVFVHLPDHYGYTRQARYDVHTAQGIRSRVISQRPVKANAGQQANRWVSLGVFAFSGTPKVSLSTLNGEGVGDESVVFDAVAFFPTTCP
ncbi:SGNH/GDSL hydrolase family protein [Microbispora catharanthi]|uniref:SGNH/GDSL hydrolase family protein n=1 Tax=Microbispora catharanthi TaxID=1712871 RepID=A0A5N6BIB1_9ACTN|nr:SGNH/GDSL hydrolase family protein [Microbispora catharanthi]KAB8180781.1 SGNH/GDSL hydrolase family protein [Microbispora catharanthi]